MVELWSTTAKVMGLSGANALLMGTLGVVGDLAVNTDKFKVVAASGDTTVAGRLIGTPQFLGYASASVIFNTTTPGRVGGGAGADGYVMMRAGSVTGWSLCYTTIDNPMGVVHVKVYKNGVALCSSADLAIGAITSVGISGTFTRGSYTFAAGDKIQLYVCDGVAGNTTLTNVIGGIEVTLDA